MKFNAILKTTTNLGDRGIEQIIALDLDGNTTLNEVVEKVFSDDKYRWSQDERFTDHIEIRLCKEMK